MACKGVGQACKVGCRANRVCDILKPEASIELVSRDGFQNHCCSHGSTFCFNETGGGITRTGTVIVDELTSLF